MKYLIPFITLLLFALPATARNIVLVLDAHYALGAPSELVTYLPAADWDIVRGPNWYTIMDYQPGGNGTQPAGCPANTENFDSFFGPYLDGAHTDRLVVIFSTNWIDAWAWCEPPENLLPSPPGAAYPYYMNPDLIMNAFRSIISEVNSRHPAAEFIFTRLPYSNIIPSKEVVELAIRNEIRYSIPWQTTSVYQMQFHAMIGGLPMGSPWCPECILGVLTPEEVAAGLEEYAWTLNPWFQIRTSQHLAFKIDPIGSGMSNCANLVNWLGHPGGPDDDNDGVCDVNLDNALGTYNPNQRDEDGDGYGTAGDKDVDNTCVVGQSDVSFIFAALLEAAPWAIPQWGALDIDGSGVIGQSDLIETFNAILTTPGPSARQCAWCQYDAQGAMPRSMGQCP